MKFGLWFEPEMISEDSDLFRAHPDYAIGVPGRPRCYSRHQYMLDLTRADVRDYIVNAVNAILHENPIEYVKWDYNRNVTDNFSLGLPAERQTEFAHRYALGLYDICERIVEANPQVFFEGCAGGGARFDPAMLHYFPQIWTSDDSDAEERTKIQYGTSIVYPLSSMSCHVSAVPNHQVKRVTSMETRGHIAHLGATGYEIDTTEFTDEDRETVRAQVEEFKAIEQLVQTGDLYRIDSPFDSIYFNEMIVSKDKTEALLVVYRRLAVPNADVKRIRLKGLDPDKTYRIEELDITAKGSTLLNVPMPIKYKVRDFYSAVYHIVEV
jgi:alpha-galactosidase